MWKCRLAAVLGVAVICLRPPPLAAVSVTGRVVVDVNGTGRVEAADPGVAGVAVSDGRIVVVTDANGAYQLPSADARVLLAMSVPRDHTAPGGWWRWTEGTQTEDFLLAKAPQPDEFLFVQMTDSHLGRVDLFKQTAERLSAFPLPLAFVVNTGDLVGGVDVVPPEKAQEQIDRYLEGAAQFRVPLFNLPGNHEHVAFNVKGADPQHPLYGKGLYRQVLGPMHYSWDWGPVHCIALDGTALPYQEKLGSEQLEWLRADLAVQPADKPLILFCHQSLPALRDASDLVSILAGRKVLAGFCGHLHQTFLMDLKGIPVYHTGALSGSWWSGANPDGSPQGFRLVRVCADRLETTYTDREGSGAGSLYVAKPPSSVLRSEPFPVELVVLDLGTPPQVSARLGDTPVALQMTSRETLWSTWQGTADTSALTDGTHALAATAELGQTTATTRTTYLIINGREAPYTATAPATLCLQVRGINAANELRWNDAPLALIPADAANEVTLRFEVPAARLRRLNQLTVRAAVEKDANRDDFSVGPVWLESGKARIRDPRYVPFERFRLGDDDPKRIVLEATVYFCMPL